MYVIIVDRSVYEALGVPLKLELSKQGHPVYLLQLTGGEELKTRWQKEVVEDFLFEVGASRTTTLIAIGGGTLLDLIGFVAATYCRGIGWIACPTTLLAMTDAAFGGKTGINLHGAKNYLGAFHPPLSVIVDVEVLTTLPQEELRYGLVETIKHGLICDASLFRFVEEYLEIILAYDLNRLRELVIKSAFLKLEVVAQDERERGLRRILNFGHTIGHAIEAVGNLPHGRAVAFGLMAESYLSHQMGHLSGGELERVVHLCQKVFPDQGVALDADPLWEAMQRDKKGGARFVVLQKIGAVVCFSETFVTSCSKQSIIESIEWAKLQQRSPVLV